MSAVFLHLDVTATSFSWALRVPAQRPQMFWLLRRQLLTLTPRGPTWVQEERVAGSAAQLAACPPGTEGPGLREQACRKQLVAVSLSLQCFSPSPFLSSKINNDIYFFKKEMSIISPFIQSQRFPPRFALSRLPGPSPAGFMTPTYASSSECRAQSASPQSSTVWLKRTQIL